jgi:hypothetical protein
MIKLGDLKQEIGQILQQDLYNLTDLHMEVQAVFQRYLINGECSNDLSRNLQYLMQNLNFLKE